MLLINLDVDTPGLSQHEIISESETSCRIIHPDNETDHKSQPGNSSER